MAVTDPRRQDAIYTKSVQDQGYVTPTVTQDELDALKERFGPGIGIESIKVGAPISQLTGLYMNRQPMEGAATDDPMLDKLVQGGWLLPGSSGGGNTGYAAGPAYQAAIDASYMGDLSTGRLPLNQTWGGAFGGAYNPGGWSSNVPMMKQLGNLMNDAKTTSISGVENVGSVDQVTGTQQHDWTNAVPHITTDAWSKIGPMFGPLIGMAVGAGMGDLGMFGDLGGLGKMLFNQAGQGLLGNKPNPLSAVGPLVNQSGEGPMSQLMSIMRNW